MRGRARILAALLLALSSTLQATMAEEPQQVHHTLDVQLDPARRSLHAVDRIDLRGTGSIEVKLAQQFEPSRSTVDGTALQPGRAADGSWTWRLALAPGRAHVLEIEYAGALAPLADADHRATLAGLAPMSDLHGSYLPAATGWYPAVGDADFSYRLTLALPPGQRGVVPGRLVEERDDAQGYRATFDFPHPVAGVELMAGPYVVRERTLARPVGLPVQLRTWFHPEIEDLSAGYLDAIGGYLDLYEAWIGPYPFREFSVVSSPLPTGFGMPTLTYLGVNVLRLPFIRATSLGHEVLHNWWGNGVYVDYAQGNWCEGLTTFMADYTYRERESAAAALEMRQSWLRDFAAIPPGEDMPLRDFTARTHGTSQIVGYHKAAFLFLMLRERLGTARFDAGLRQFWNTYQFRRAGWADLVRAFEAAAAEPLGGFFAQWLERRGAPQLSVESAHAVHEGTTYRLSLVLAQAGEPYSLALPVVIETQSGTETRTVQLNEARQSLVLETTAAPRSVQLDPNLRVFRRLDPRELPPILRQVMLDPATRVDVALPAAEREAGLALARALLDHAPAAATNTATAPRLIIGTHAGVDAVLADAGLPPRPAALANRGTAQVWTATTTTGRPLAVISARDAAALQALARPLPHYGRQSWLVFEGGKAVDRGVWPTAALTTAVELR